jgi:anti-anti-sigma regulatory factor
MAPACLKDLEQEVKELTSLAGLDLNEEVRQVIVELVQLDVVPTAIAQVLKSLCNKAKNNTQQQLA